MSEENIVLSSFTNSIQGDEALRLEVDQTLNTLSQIPEFQAIMVEVLKDRPEGLVIETGTDPVGTHFQNGTILIDRSTFEAYYKTGVPSNWTLNTSSDGSVDTRTVYDHQNNDVTSTFISDNITSYETGYPTFAKFSLVRTIVHETLHDYFDFSLGETFGGTEDAYVIELTNQIMYKYFGEAFRDGHVAYTDTDVYQYFDDIEVPDDNPVPRNQLSQNNLNIPNDKMQELINEIELKIESDLTEGQINTDKPVPLLTINSQGQLETVFMKPGEARIAAHDAEVADFVANGTVVSQTTGTASLYGSTFDLTETTYQKDGEQITISEYELPSGAAFPANGVRAQRFETKYDDAGNPYVAKEETQFVDSAGRIHDTEEFRESPDGNWHVRENIQGATEPGEVYIVPSDGLLSALQFAGGTAGSFLGNHLADGNVYKSVIYSAFLKTVGQHFGTFASYLAVENTVQNSLDVAINGGSTQGTAFENAAFTETFLNNLQASVSGALANVIVDEVGDTLGIEGTLVGEVFDVAAGVVTTGIISGGIDVLFRGLEASVYANLIAGEGVNFATKLSDLNLETPVNIPGVDTVGDYVQFQVANALGAYVGGALAGELIEAESEVAALFGAAGSAVATAIATGGLWASSGIAASFLQTFGWAGGPIGAAIGAFIGTIAGTALGNQFGGEENPAAWSFLYYNPNSGEYEIYGSYVNDGGPTNISESMANAVVNGINSIVASTGGALRHTAEAQQLEIGWREGTYFVKIRDGGGEFEFGSAGDAVEFATLHTLKSFDLVGGHAVVMRAWHNSEADTITEWKEDIEVAEAFQLYLTNPAGILALMMDQPDSELAQSWAAILQRAAELELHLPHEKDIDGGWNELLLARGIFDPSVVPDIQGDSIVLTDPVTGEETVLHHVIGPGYEIVRIEGTDGNDIIEVIVDGPSITYVDAGAGDDTVEGSDERDIILGGAGDDVINGNDGDDWINGGTGEDTIHGNGGLDLIYGGDDNDTLFGDEEGDAIYGGLGDDTLDGLDGDDELFGGAGNDTLTGGEGSDLLKGEAGDDVLNGNAGDTLIGGEGNDTFNLSGLNASVVISRGEGHDIINGNATDRNIIKFDRTIGPNELWHEAQGDDLLISILGEDQSILVKDIFATTNPSKYIFDHADQLRMVGSSDGVHTAGTFIWEEAHLNETYTANNTWSGPTGQYNIIAEADLQAKYAQYETWINQEAIPSFMLAPYNSYSSYGVWQAYKGDPVYIGTEADESFGIGGTPDHHYTGMILAGAGDDTVTGPASYDANGYEYIYGDSGDDYLYAGFGNDIVSGGLGVDTIIGDRGNDILYGGAGDDIVHGGLGNDKVYGGHGNDTITGGGSHDEIHGGVGNDTIIDNDGNNIIYGDEGNDTITIQGYSSNLIYGGTGNDTITGYTGQEVVYGGEGNDILQGGAGADKLHGEAGDDRLIFTLADNGTEEDYIDGGEGTDTLVINLTVAEFALDKVQRDLLRFKTESAAQQASSTFLALTLAFMALGVSSVEALEIYVDGVADDISYADVTGTTAGEQLDGSASHDHIIGDEGDDTLNGYAGHDRIVGGGGDDVVNGGDGLDDIYGGEGNDTLAGDAGEDEIHGGDGDDDITGGTGDDLIFAGAGADTVDGGADADTIYGGENDDVLDGGDGDDALFGESGNDTLNGGAGSDTLDGGAGDDILNGGLGDDLLNGGLGDDEYVYALGDGHDQIIDAYGDADFIHIGTGVLASDIIFNTTAENDLIITFDGQANDSITILKQGTNLIPVETLLLDQNSEELALSELGINASDDAITTGEDQSITISVLSNDNGFSGGLLSLAGVVNGPQNGDAVINGDGTITYTPSLNFYGEDTFTYSASDLFGNVGEAQVTISVTDEPTIAGTSSGETLTGTSGHDEFEGLAGDDTLDGGLGDDTYYYNVGDGHDTIVESGGYDTIVLGAGLTVDDVTVDTIWDGNNTMTINFAGTSTDSITYNIAGNSRLEKLVFDDGTEWTLYNAILGTAGNDTLYGDAADNYISGSTGVDVVYGGDGNDIVYGSTHDDTVYGEGGDDYIWVRGASDTIDGGTGTDTILLGSSFHGITFPDHTGTGVVNLAAGTISNDGIGGSHTVSNVENVRGAVGNDTITGDANANVLDGYLGNDTLYGGGGDDTLIGGLGNDTLNGGFGSDIALYSGAYADYTITDNGTYHTVLDNVGSDGSDSVYDDVEQIVFNDGYLEGGVFYSNSPKPIAETDLFDGTEDEDVTGNVLVDNGNGVDSDPEGDTLSVQAETVTSTQGGTAVILENGDFTYTPAANVNGNDSFEYTLIDQYGAFSTGLVNLTIAPVNDPLDAVDDSVSLAKDTTVDVDVLSNDINLDNDSLTVSIVASASHGAVLINNDNTISYTPDLGYSGGDSFRYQISDGAGDVDTGVVTIDVQDTGPFTIAGTASGETLDGSVYVDNISPLAGDDTVNALAGDDVISYTDGFDTYNAGDGEDTVDFSGFVSAVWVDLDYGANYEAWTVDLTNVNGGNWRAIADLNDVENLIGSDFDDKLWGDAGNNIIIGGTGNDILSGEAGDDTYYYNVGDGHDTINESGGFDRIVLGAGITAADVMIDNIHDGNNTMTISFVGTSTDSITYSIAGNARLEKLTFDDGTEWSLFNAIIGTAGSDTLYGDAGDNYISGSTGTDSVYGGDGDDLVYGSTHNDNVYGEAGNDYIWVRGESDTIDGGTGIDTILLGSSFWGMSFPDHMGTGIVDLSAGTISNDGIGGSHTVSNVENVRGAAGNDTITGDANANVLDGQLGNDTLNGGGGDDILIGGEGNDILYGGADADIFAFESMDGSNDIISDFSVADGDAIDIADLLTGYDPLTDAIEDFVHITTDSTHSYLRIDADGGADGFVQIAQISNTTGLTDEEALETSGTLITV